MKRTVWALAAAAGALMDSSGCGLRDEITFRPTKLNLLGTTVEFAQGIGTPGEPVDGLRGDDEETVFKGGMAVAIKSMKLSVNGRPYGSVKQGDHIFIEKDKVSVNGEVRAAPDK